MFDLHRHVTRWIMSWTWILLLWSMFFVSLGLIDPSWWIDTSIHDEKWFDVVVMLDVSKSMNVMDMAGWWRASRLEVAKKTLWEYVMSSPENRYGLGVFAGESIWIAPLTNDVNLFLTFLWGVDSGNLTEQWTDLLEAVWFGVARFWWWDTDDEIWWRVLIVVSDWWEDEITIPRQMKETLDELWVFLVTIWVWTRQWWPIPVWRDAFGNMSFKQQNGKTVMSSFNEKWLRSLALAWRGAYLWVDSLSDISKTLSDINWLEQKIISKQTDKKRYIWRWFVWVWFLFFIWYLLSMLTHEFTYFDD